ncbi:MAG TPA: 3-hydroxyacyl-ACP dehydratase [Candidatus Avacidaminococcus intestinavium]|uniref:3-hydroxyacyl-ACP dehydratase n=1 Tax=Candidatus Avacidaminococcus intestinavium TaxID=2840684 RepID=A0A9D1SLL7_9FIRM|nr:3-hydroxyacyl-ACP dehydratase [Candidatus Avacidaminococcus intestinavium]
MTKIENLLPQRPPFLMVDKLLFSSRSAIIGEKTFDKNFLFYQQTKDLSALVPSPFLIEALVQCGGAGLKQCNLLGSNNWVLAKVIAAEFWQEVQKNDTIRLVVTTQKVSAKLLQQSGNVYLKANKILYASWLCIPLKNG